AFIAAARRAGAELKTGERVEEILTEAGRVTGVKTDKGRYSAPRVILAAGIYGNDLLAPLGYAVPLDVQMVTVLRSVPVAPVLAQVIGVASGNWAGRQEVTGRFRVTSGAQPWPGNMTITEDAEGKHPAVAPPMATLASVVAQMERLLPGTTSVPVEAVWAGLLDMTPDALPVLDQVPGVEGLILGMGFSGHGFCLGPVTGRVLSSMALGEAPEFDLGAFRAARFNDRRNMPREALTLHG
ncbi:MAG TPA: FAD-binding oxidoreductase, partial [Paenirhodobacter sp.]